MTSIVKFIWDMKMPQLWCTSRVVHFIVLLPNWRHLVTSRDVKTLVRYFIKVNPCTSFGVGTSNSPAVKMLTDRQTHTQTNGTALITSTAGAGGKHQVLSTDNGNRETEGQDWMLYHCVMIKNVRIFINDILTKIWPDYIASQIACSSLLCCLLCSNHYLL